MFTGIVQGIGRIRAIEPGDGDISLVVDAGGLGLEGTEIGDSIAVNGACLTVTRLAERTFAADVSRETLSMTTLGDWRPGTAVNLEKAIVAGQALGGHYVTGHVDGVGEVMERSDDARSVRIEFEAPHGLGRFLRQPRASYARGDDPRGLRTRDAGQPRSGHHCPLCGAPDRQQLIRLIHWSGAQEITILI
jgi:riboflavin synthase